MTTRRFRLAVVLLALLGTAGWFGWRWYTTPKPPTISLEGVSKERAEKIEEALQAVRREPRSGRAWGALGMTLLANGLEGPALPCFEHAQRFDPQQPRWPYFQGSLLLTSKPRAAFVKLREALAVAGAPPVRKEILFILAVALVEDGQLDEAERHLREMQALDGDDPAVHFGLGLLAVARDDRAGTVEHLGRLTDHPSARKRACALLAAASSDRQRAEDYRRRAAELPDDRPWPGYFEEEIGRYRAIPEQKLAKYLELKNQGRDAEAIAFLQEFVAQTPDEGSCFILGFELFKLNRFEESERYLRQAAGFNPRNPKTHLFQGISLYQLGERARERGDAASAQDLFQQAVAVEDKALALQNDIADAHLTRGRALKRLNRTDDALAALRQAVRTGTEYAEMHQALGEALAEAGQVREGLEHLEDAVRLAKPNDPQPRQALEKWKGKAKDKSKP